MSEDKLPAGWALATLGELLDRLQYGYTAKAEPNAAGPRFLRITDLGEAGVEWDKVPTCTISNEDLQKYLLAEDDIVFARSGSIEKAWRVLEPPNAVFASYLIRGRPIFKPLSKLIAHFLKSRSYLQQIGAAAAGSGMQNVNAQKLAGVCLPLPPLPEQKRIVRKIEDLQSRSKRAREALESVPALIEKFRQSVLAAAFRGDLTKEWREKNKDKIEPASELLKRIRVERRKKWEEEQLRKFQAAGKPPKDDSWKRKYTEPEAVDTEGLPELPEGWCWLPIGQLCDVVRGGSPRPAGDCRYYDGPIPFLKVADLTNSQGIYVDEAKSSIKQAGLSRTRWVAPSTLMLSNSGATLGVPKICTFGTTFNDGVAAFLGLAETDLKYHCYFWMSKTRSLRAINQGAAQPNLNTDLIANVMIPLCSIEEQEQVVAKLERTLSTCANISTVVGERLLQIDSLDQSILAKAFRGELVPQDPSEEPASVLLGRIKAEKEQGAPAKKTTKGKLQKTKSVEA